MPNPALTNPNIVIKPHKDAKPCGDKSGKLQNQQRYNMHELPLVFHRIGAVGSRFIFIGICEPKLGMLSETQLRHANIAAFVIMIIALAIGGLHVGQPLRFFNMLLGVGRSPMSNEAFA